MTINFTIEEDYYLNHYKNFIKENFHERFGETTSIEFCKEMIIANAKGSESKTLTSELVEISEIPDIIILKIKGGQALVIPQKQITDISALISFLKKFAVSLNINYSIENQWKWK